MTAIPGARFSFPRMITRLKTTYADSVCTLLLQPPEGKPPTLDYAVLDALESELAGIEAHAAEFSAVVVRSASPKFFCAGANIQVLETIDRHSIAPWVRQGHRLLNRLEALPLPVIACVEGYAMGGGLELAMACDVIFASNAARFGQSETKLGFVTGWGGSYRLVRRVGVARAKELVFSGRLFDAAEAVQWGVAEWQGTPVELERHLHDYLMAVKGNSRVAIREMKQILTACPDMSLEENAAIEADASQRCLTEGDAAERLRTFLQKKSAPSPKPSN